MYQDALLNGATPSGKQLSCLGNSLVPWQIGVRCPHEWAPLQEESVHGRGFTKVENENV
jgi:hypothetical protein